MTLLAERPTRQVMTPPLRPEFRLRSEMQFAALPAALVCSQLLVKYTLQSWRLDELIEPVHQIVTELVTRAVLTTGITELHPRWVEFDDIKLTTVRLLVIEQRLIVEVADTDPTFTMMDESTGLQVLPSLCKRWSYYALPTGGKSSGANYSLIRRPPTSTKRRDSPCRRSPSECRIENREPVDPIEVMDDPAMLRRVRDGLRSCDDDSPGGKDMR